MGGGGGGGSDGKGTLIGPELTQRQGRSEVERQRHSWAETQGGRQEGPKKSQAWDRDDHIHTGCPERPHCSQCRRQERHRRPLSHTPTLDKTCPHRSWRGGDNQVPGGRPDTTCPSGLGCPTCPIWDLLAFSLPLSEDRLKIGWQMAPGGSGGRSRAVL